MIPPQILEAMARAAYEASRTPSFPAWADVTEGYRADARRSLVAALEAAGAIGWTFAPAKTEPAA